MEFEDFVLEASRYEIPAIAPWRHTIADIGAPSAHRIVDDLGLRVSSLCRGGLFTAPGRAGRQALDETRRAIEDARELDAQTLVIVCGGLPDRDIAAARGLVYEALATLIPFAADAGVRLAIEPLHPMMVTDRSVVTSMREANDIVEEFADPHLGLIVDAYHVWWDAHLEQEIQRAAGRLFGYHVSDWVLPLTEHLSSRGMPGEGCIDLHSISAWMDQSGYRGDVEVEVLSNHWWSQPSATTLDAVVDSFQQWV